jgi:hypothetical protein
MADGRKVPSVGVWKGRVTVGGISRKGVFEIFNSNGAWAMLFGKPLLKTFNAVHDYTVDTIQIPPPNGTTWVVLTNQFTNPQGVAAKLLANRTLDIKQIIDLPKEDATPPWNGNTPEQEKVSRAEESEWGVKAYELHGGLTIPLEGSLTQQSHNSVEPDLTDKTISPEDVDMGQNEAPEAEWSSVWLLDEAAGTSTEHPGTEQPDIPKAFKPTILTRKTAPHNPERVNAILEEVTIGQDLTPDQTQQVRDLIAKYAECFALSMSEVTTVEGAAHWLDIPRDMQFRTKVNQRPQSPPQREFFNGVIDKMLEAGII